MFLDWQNVQEISEHIEVISQDIKINVMKENIITLMDKMGKYYRLFRLYLVG